MMFSALDPVLHSQVRLAVMSLLVGVRSAEFSYLLESIPTTKGNLSFQLGKLKEAGRRADAQQAIQRAEAEADKVKDASMRASLLETIERARTAR